MHSYIHMSCHNSGHFVRINRKFRYLRICQHFLNYSSKFWENFIEIDAIFDENYWKIAIFAEISAKIWKSLTKIYEDFEFRAVQRCGNLVDLEKRCKMSIWTQKSALIQPRTSLLKFWLKNLRKVRYRTFQLRRQRLVAEALPDLLVAGRVKGPKKSHFKFGVVQSPNSGIQLWFQNYKFQIRIY